MSQAAGFSVLPITISLRGINEELRKQLTGPTQRASKQAGETIRKEMSAGVDQAAKNVEKANWRVKKSADELTTAESKLSEAKLKSEAANKAVEAAARKRAEAESKGIDAVEKAEQDLLKKRAAAEREARNLAAAEGNVEKAMSESARAAKSLADRQAELDKAQGETEKSSKGLRDRLREMGDEAGTTGGMFDGLIGKVGGLAGAFAGVAGVAGFASLGKDLAGEISLVNRQLGLTGAAAEAVGAQVKEALKSGVAASAEEAAQAVGNITQTFDGVGQLGGKTAAELSDNFLAFTKTFEVDMAEAVSTVNVMMNAGLASSAEEGVDLLTGSLQKVPQALQGEVIDAMNEYSKHFSNMGIDGSQAMAMLVDASDNGQYAIDKLGDSVKELSVRAIDPAVIESLSEYGVSVDDMAGRVARGGEEARYAMQELATQLSQIPDEGVRAEAAVVAFGTPVEDLAVDQIPAFLDSLTSMSDGMEDTEGASQDLADIMANSLDGRLRALKGTVEGLAGDAFMWLWDTVQNRVIPGFQDTVGWVKENEAWIGPLAASVGAAATAWGLWTAAVKGWEVATKIATGVQAAFNVVMAANPIMLAAMAVAGLAAGLVYFFTQTETGQEMWEKFTTALGDGWDWVTEKIGGGIDWIQGKFEAFTSWMSTAWSGITSLFQGDFTSQFREAFGLEEDNPLIVGFLKLHDILTGIPGTIKGITDILFRGDYTEAPFGLGEDSGLVDVLFNIRETVIKTGEVISAVWDGIVQAGKIAFAILGTVVLTPIMITWNALSELVKWGWETLIKPAWDAMSGAAMWLWETVLSPAFSAIVDGWQWLSDRFAAVWETIRTSVFDAWNWYIGKVQENWALVTGALSAAWTLVRDTFIPIWDAIRATVFDAWNAYVDRVKANWDLVTGALNAAWTWVKDTFSSVWEMIRTAVFDAWNAYTAQVRANWDMVTGALNTAWEGVKSVFGATWDWIRDNVFSKFNTAIDLMRSGAEIAMDGIGKAFDWLREKTAKPVNFVIETVYMGGIRPAWQAVASLVDLEELPKIDKIGGFAQGTARVPGPRTPYDNVHMVSQDGQFGISLRGGEGVLVPEAVDGLGEGAINALNHAGLHGGKRAVDRVLNALNLGAFARGGFVDLGGFNFGGVTNLAGNLSGIQRSHAQFVGRFFPGLFNLTSAGRNEPGSYHDFGAMAATDWQAKDGQFATQMPTAGSKALARAIFKNFSNSAELIHWPLDGWQNINNGGPHNYGAGTNAAHANHVHWATRSPLQFDGDNIVLEDVGGGGFFETITNMAKRLWDGIIDKVPSFPGADSLGKFGQLPGAWLKTVASAAWEHIKGLADKLMPFGGDGGGAEQWRGLASQALRRHGYDDRYLEAMLQQIQIESTGDPGAVNRWDSNWLRGTPSGGLLQVIEPTYRRVRNAYPEAFEGLPDDHMHPATNLTAGVGAVRMDWGGPGGRWPTRDGYHDGGLAGAGRGWLRKTAIEPEFVLNPEATEAFVDWLSGRPQAESAAVIAREIREAFRGGDWGYGELGSVIGYKNAERLVDEVSWMGGAVDEIKAAWAGGDDGYASVMRYMGGNERLSKQLLEEVSWAGGAVDEIRAAWTGGDSGYASVARYLGGNEKLAKALLNRVESIGAVTEELAVAWAGGDWGYGELSQYMGEDMARETVNVVAATGELTRAVDSWVRVAMSQIDMGAVNDAGRGYLEAQATGVLDMFGLGGLVRIGSHLADEYGPQAYQTAQALYGAATGPADSTATVSAFGHRATFEFNAESLDDVVRVGDIADALNRLDGVEAKVNEKKRPMAAAVTRGGAM